MGLYKLKPLPSGRMGILCTLAPIRDAALVEFGCMGHMRYSSLALTRAGIIDGCRLYSTHIEETDIALGSTDKLNHTIKNVITRDNPRVIFLQPSSVPEVIGTDISALADELQLEYPDVKIVPFTHGGFNVSQHRGVQEALLTLVKFFHVDAELPQKPAFNIIGSCPDLFRFQSDADEILRIMEGAFGMSPLCVLSSNTSITEIKKMGGARINLVIRREGEPAAKYLQDKFGTPYLSGRPYGIEGTEQWVNEISRLLGLPANSGFINAEIDESHKLLFSLRQGFGKKKSSKAELSLGGHADVVKGILSYGCEELHFSKGTCWCDCPEMGTEEIPYFSEDEWMNAVKSHKYGYLMASGEILDWAGCSSELQISNPDTKWHIYPYEPPFVGFRGAAYLANLWVNSSEKIKNTTIQNGILSK